MSYFGIFDSTYGTGSQQRLTLYVGGADVRFSVKNAEGTSNNDSGWTSSIHT